MSNPWQQPGPPRQQYYPQDGNQHMRAPPPRHPQRPMPPPGAYQYPPRRPGPPPQQYQGYGHPQPQHRPQPNVLPPPNSPPHVRPPVPRGGGPPGRGPIPVRPQMRPDDLGIRQDPGYGYAPRKKSTAGADPRASQYTASVYSAGSSPKTSPEVAQMPTMSDMHNALRRNNSGGRSIKPRASSFYGDNPFMDNIPEVPEIPEQHGEHTSPRSRSTSDGSDTYGAYPSQYPTVVTPLEGEPKGLDGILAASNPTTPQEQPLVRQASLGKRQKAALTTVRASEHRSVAPSVRYDELDDHYRPAEDERSVAPSSTALGIGMIPAPLSPRPRPKSPLAYDDKHFDDESMISSDRSLRTPSPQIGGSWPLRSPGGVQAHAKSPSDRSQRSAPLSPPKSRFSREWGEHNKNQGAGGVLFQLPERKKSLKDRVGEKAPQSIDMHAVREAEARGSMTSLPGLLNRALQMASNLERGKTSSKQSDWFGNDLLRELGERGKSTASLSTMLNAKQFAFSPQVGADQNRGSGYSEKWPRPAPLPPSGLRQQSSYNRYDDDQPRKRSKYDHRRPPPPRKCCGIPLWLFFVILLTALVLVILAVVLPVALIVIPNDRKAADPTCESKHPCANGGVAVPDNSGNCQCICPGTYSGANCTSDNGPGSCGNIQAATLPNAAIGSQLPPLISSAESSYQVPLNATSILTAFSISDVDCDIQNTLVAISSANSRRRRAAAPLTTDAPSSPHAHHHVARQNSDQATTAGGLVIAGPGGTSTSSAPTSSPSKPSTTQFTDTNHLNFAKTAILYTLQVSQRLDFAVQASQKLQPFFNGLGSGTSGSTDPKNVDMGNGWTLDLVDLKVTGMGTSAGTGNGQSGNP